MIKTVILFFSIFVINCADQLTVHIIPHTHDDVGWLYTMEDYYYGTNGSDRSVRRILNNMVNSLTEDKNRTFIYVEIAFFEKWWNEIDESIKEIVKGFVKEGRLEFINGAYSMHDEAASYYQHSIDNMRLGLLFLKREFNITPDIAWSIDPFGHSASNVKIFIK